MMMVSRLALLTVLFALLPTGCAGARNINIAGGGLGIYMAYEVVGRVSSDTNGCGGAVADASAAMFDDRGALLDETKTDSTGRFALSVRDPDVADHYAAKLDQDDPTVQVTLRVQTNAGQEQRFNIRLPRPVHGREYRVRFDARPTCEVIP